MANSDYRFSLASDSVAGMAKILQTLAVLIPLEVIAALGVVFVAARNKAIDPDLPLQTHFVSLLSDSQFPRRKDVPSILRCRRRGHLQAFPH